MGFDNVLDNVGQVYPRSLDLDVVSALMQVSSGPKSFATTLRLMAGAELGTEGFLAAAERRLDELEAGAAEPVPASRAIENARSSLG